MHVTQLANNTALEAAHVYMKGDGTFGRKFVKVERGDISNTMLAISYTLDKSFHQNVWYTSFARHMSKDLSGW